MKAICSECGEPIKPAKSAFWLLPGWPNKWKAQNPIPFHPECVER